MTEVIQASRDEALLRTLSPALRQLERGLRAWLDGPHRYPLTMMTRAARSRPCSCSRRWSPATPTS